MQAYVSVQVISNTYYEGNRGQREFSKSCAGSVRIKGGRALQARPHFLLSLPSLDRNGGSRVVYGNATETSILCSPQVWNNMTV